MVVQMKETQMNFGFCTHFIFSVAQRMAMRFQMITRIKQSPLYINAVLNSNLAMLANILVIPQPGQRRPVNS